MSIKRRKRNYVNNVDFLEAIKKYHLEIKDAEERRLNQIPPIPKYIGECLFLIANNLAYKPNFINYSYRDEMISDGLENAVMAFYNFDPNKSENPFAYFTQIIYFAFIRRIQKEKKQMYVKYKSLINSNINDTSFDHNVGDDYVALTNNDFDNDQMNSFVAKYESTLEEKKKNKKVKDDVTSDNPGPDPESI